MKNTLFCLTLFLCVGCGGGGSTSGGGSLPPPTNETAQIAGKWELIGSSIANPGSNFPYTGIGVNLRQTSTSVSSSDQGTIIIPFVSYNPGVGLSQGACNTFTGTLSGTVSEHTLIFSLTETDATNSLVISGTGTINSQNNTITGSYTTPGGCGSGADNGTFTGVAVPSVSGSYSASFNDGTTTTLQITEDSQQNITATGSLQGQSFNLAGNIVGGVLEAQGNVPGYGQITYLGFYMSPGLVSIFPTVFNTSTRVGDFFLMNAGDLSYYGLARKQ